MGVDDSPKHGKTQIGEMLSARRNAGEEGERTNMANRAKGEGGWIYGNKNTISYLVANYSVQNNWQQNVIVEISCQI